MEGLATLRVSGTWSRLHRAESEVLAALLDAEERAAVARRLGYRSDPAWIPPTTGPQGARFSPPLGPGALYLADGLDTCVAEVAHHHARMCAASRGTPPGTRALFRHLRFGVSGLFADATPDPALRDPGDYGPSWAFGARARQEGLDGVHYPSARREEARCLAVFRAGSARLRRTEAGAILLEWDGARSRRIA
jgi:RES domain-containing protein